MPSKSKAQEKLMLIASKSPEFAKKVGIKQTTAKEWHEEDKKAGKRKLPEKVADKKKKESDKKPSNETYVTTASLNGGRGFRDH